MSSSYSTFLFALPSFLEGFGRVLDVGNTFDEYNKSAQPDSLALFADWKAVGRDIQNASVEDCIKMIEQLRKHQDAQPASEAGR